MLFLECICDDPTVLSANYALKMRNADYRSQTIGQATRDFKARVAAYERMYEPMGRSSDEDDVSFIKVINVGRTVVANRCGGFLPGLICQFLGNLHITPRRIWLTRHGQSQDNAVGRIGGDSPLTEAGHEFARRLRSFLSLQRADAGGAASSSCRSPVVWTSSLRRAVQTIEPLREDLGDLCYQTPLLNEINAGMCEGLTYEEIRDRFPAEFRSRREDKLRYRYPRGGESYLDIVARLRPLVVELERLECDVLIVCHQAIARTILAYFTDLPWEKMPLQEIPLHTVLQLQSGAFGSTLSQVRLGPSADGAAATAVAPAAPSPCEFLQTQRARL